MTNTAEVINLFSPKVEQKPVDRVEYVKADLEDGYTQVANSLLYAIGLNEPKMPARELQLLAVIIAKTYGYHKPTDWLAHGQLAELTGILRDNVGRLISSMISKCVLRKDGKKIGINPVLSEWKQHVKKGEKAKPAETVKLSNPTVATVKSDEKTVKSDSLACQIQPPQKKENSTRETTTKEISPNCASWPALELLNRLTGQRYRKSKSALGNGNGRLADGNSLDDLKLVIEFKSAQWLNTDNSQYLRPQTLFQPGKFDGYLLAAKNWDGAGRPAVDRFGNFAKRDINAISQPNNTIPDGFNC